MDTTKAITGQYRAALDMLESIIVACPGPLWNDPQDTNRFWQVAYHAVFYTHLYLQPSLDDFVPWAKGREGHQQLGHLSKEALDQSAYTPEEVLEYLALCREQVGQIVPTLDLEGPCGFHWWSEMDKLEFQFYNIRHLQHHTGELYERAGARANAELPWIGTRRD